MGVPALNGVRSLQRLHSFGNAPVANVSSYRLEAPQLADGKALLAWRIRVC